MERALRDSGAKVNARCGSTRHFRQPHPRHVARTEIADIVETDTVGQRIKLPRRRIVEPHLAVIGQIFGMDRVARGKVRRLIAILVAPAVDAEFGSRVRAAGDACLALERWDEAKAAYAQTLELAAMEGDAPPPGVERVGATLGMATLICASAWFARGVR